MKGVCIRKLNLTESYLGFYGKYLSTFELRTESNFETKLGNGDIVGLFTFELKIQGEPIQTGVINKMFKSAVQVAFDNLIEPVEI